MDAVGSRINGQPSYGSAVQNRNVWREEMLEQILGQVRDHQTIREDLAPAVKELSVPGKGSFVDIYV